jgi:hypothetical protein
MVYTTVKCNALTPSDARPCSSKSRISRRRPYNTSCLHGCWFSTYCPLRELRRGRVWCGASALSHTLMFFLLWQGPGYRQFTNPLSGTVIVSPSAVIVYMENIGFAYPAMSMMVIGPSLPILRQSRWSLLYDVYWLEVTMLNNGYNGYNR